MPAVVVRGKNLWRLFLLLCCCLLMQACSQFPLLFQSKQEQVEQLLSQQQFYPALDIIDKTPATAPDYQSLMALRQQVLDSIGLYEKASLTHVDKLIKTGQWADALLAIDQALEHIPASKILLRKRADTSQHIAAELEKLRLELALERAKSLPRENQLLSQIEHYDSSDTLKQLINTRQQDAREASNLLTTEAKRLMARREWQKARQYALLASQLSTGNDGHKLLADIDHSLQAYKTQALRKALDDKDLLAAKQLAQQMRGAATNEDIKTLLDEFNQTLQLTVLQLTREGQQAYTRGDINKAISLWQQAIKLDEGNGELRKLLERAQAFQNNYQRFKQN